MVFVLSTQGIEYATPAGTLAAVAYLEHHGARLVSQGDGVYVLVWHPRPGTHRLVLPATATPPG